MTACGENWVELMPDYLKIKSKQFYLSLRRFVLYYLARPFLFKKERPFNQAEIEKILVVRIERIGDLVASFPALKLLKQVFKPSKISVLVREDTASLLQSIGYIDEVIIHRGFRKTIRQLRKEEFDLAIDPLMDYRLNTALLAYAAGARFTAGFDIEARGCFFNLKVRPAIEKKDVGRHILDLIKAIAEYYSKSNAYIEPGYPELPISENNRTAMKSYLQESGVGENDLLAGIHPGAHFPSQRWPIDKFSELADKIAAKYKTKILIIASNKENRLTGQMVNLMKEKAIRISGLSLDKLAALISLLDIFICNNSGPLHIACAVNTPTVSTMGPTDPALWWPQGQNRHIVIRRGLFCSPCNRPRCRKHKCMKLISVDEVLQAVDEQMQGFVIKK